MEKIEDLLSRLEKEFQRAYTQWCRGTTICSSPVQIRSHPAYQELLSFGFKIIPLIFKEYRRDPTSDLAMLLGDITGENIIPDYEQGNMDKIRKRWLNYGRSHRYIE